MPTGYTSYIQDGKIDNAKDFIMLCARAFGACIDMRDDSLDKPISEFKADDYHLNALLKTQKELDEIKAMTDEEIQKEIDNCYKKEMTYREKGKAKALELKNKYTKVLNEVEQWGIPTNEHIKLKEFAINQIKDSIRCDCGTDYYDLEYIKPTVEEYKKHQLDSCLKNIEYHSKAYREEVKRTDERNKWIKDLRDSFK